ncbi:MAG: DUF3369 domain-containing protein [Parvibaculaceae bacterium]|nr:DUF3369 domain-containing protein [Parvibaculaceae bacterium]
MSLLFADTSKVEVTKPLSPTVAQKAPWKVLVVDDEPEVHAVTRLALHDFVFSSRPLQLISGYSAKDARVLLKEHADIAVILLDVVMETDHAGLDLVHHIREELGNSAVRIILRTGQAGQAPQRNVIANYDINDYKEKTELTSLRLFTSMHSSLRSYRDIIELEEGKRGLENIIGATAHIFEYRSIISFAEGALEQLVSLLLARKNHELTNINSLIVKINKDTLVVLSASGTYRNLKSVQSPADLPVGLRDRLLHRSDKPHTIHSDGWLHLCLNEDAESHHLIFIDGLQELSKTDINLIDLFLRNVSITFDNLALQREVEETQREIVYRLGEAVESRSKETGNHVKRVAKISRLLAEKYGMSPEQADIILYASPLHDIGKIAIPDAILNKPGKLNAEEWEIMQTHAILGYDMLKSSNRQILKAGAIIARDHHEKWNGKGYPAGKTGEDIDIMGRITAVADVFDALGSDRCYKQAWPIEKVLALFREERGEHFDPRLVDLLFENLEDVCAIREQHSDEYLGDAETPAAQG